MFVITKEFMGRPFASYENPNTKESLSRLAEELTSISADPRFSLRVSVQPRPVAPADEHHHQALLNA